MSIIFSSILIILAIEFFGYLSITEHLQGLSKIINKSLYVITSAKISDHWKECVLLMYAQKMALHAVFMGVGILACGLLILIPAYLLDRFLLLSPSVIGIFLNFTGLVKVSSVALSYLALRKILSLWKKSRKQTI